MITRSRIIAGPAYLSLGSGPVNWRSSSAVKVGLDLERIPIRDPLVGTIDEVVKNRKIVITHRPLYYDPSVTIALFMPWISMAGTVPGSEMWGADNQFTVVGNNGDSFQIPAACITKMPDLFLGVENEVFSSDMEITGIGMTGIDPATEADWLVISTGNSFSAPAIPGTSVLGRQKFTAAWGSFAGFTSFQGFKGFNKASVTKIISETDPRKQNAGA